MDGLIGVPLHMDCSELLQKLPDASIDCVITDPPFGTGTYKEDKEPPVEVWGELKRVCPDGPIAVFGYAKNLFKWANFFQDMSLIGFIVWHHYVQVIVSPGLSRVHQDIAIWGRSQKQVRAGKVREPYSLNKALEKYGGGGSGETRDRLVAGYKGRHPDGRRCTDLWKIAGNFHGFHVRNRLHKNQKPSEILRRLILLLTNEGDLILDPFAGSFTTAIVARRFGRRWISCDIDPQCVSVGKERLRKELF